MTTWGVTICFAVALGLVACSDDAGDGSSPTTEQTSSSTTTTAPERPSSTTTTAFDPASVKGQVEAAYLKSWDVYADAVYDLVLDEAALAEVYGDELLKVTRAEIQRRIDERRAALVEVDHDYSIDLTADDKAVLVDRYVNHQVLIDPETKKPIEADPNTAIADAFDLRREGARWIVVNQVRLT
ncbi:MAG: hypothetical protein ACJ739_06540, partial [Acidimicrobiales bacterium]